MFDGKMLRELAGTPIRSTDLANSPLALAEPEPLTLANLTPKSLTAVIAAGRDSDCTVIVFSASSIKSSFPRKWESSGKRRIGRPGSPPSRGRRGRLTGAACRAGLCHVEKEFAHVPGAGRAAL